MSTIKMTSSQFAEVMGGGTNRPLKKISRRRGGLLAKANGAHLEKMIKMGEIDAQGRVCALDVLPSCGAAFHGANESHRLKMPYDACGAFCPDGRGFFFDAKSSDDKNGIQLDRERILKHHQAIALMAKATTGAIAGLLVYHTSTKEFLWLDARHLIQPTYLTWDSPRWLRIGNSSRPPQFRLILNQYNEWRSKQ